MNKELMVNNIKELCKNRNMTVTGLEEVLGFSQGLIGRWKDKSPSIDRIVDIADYFNVQIDDIIGRSMQTSDLFLETLYNMTNNKTFRWSKLTPDRKYIIAPKMTEVFNEDIYNELYYYTEFDEGFITMYCFSQYDKTLCPKELNMYIQPSISSSRVYQNYSTEQLLPLWVLILSKIEDVPDDVKAENMKQKLLLPNLFTSRIHTYSVKLEEYTDTNSDNQKESRT